MKHIKRNQFLRVFILLYQLAPRYALGITALRAVVTCLPILRILTITHIINSIQGVVDRSIDVDKLWGAILLLLSIEFFGGISRTLSQELGRKSTIYLNQTQYPNLIHHIGNLDYFCFEDKETLELITRIKKNYVPKTISSFTTSLYFIETLFVALSIVINLSREVGVWAFTILFVSIPLIIAGQKSGMDFHQGEVEREKKERHLEYIENIYSEREFAAERSLFPVSQMIEKAWNNTYVKVEGINRKWKKSAYVRMCIANILSYLGYAAVIAILCIFLVQGNISSGVFISTVIIILRLMFTLSYTLSSDISELSRNISFSKDYERFYNLPRKEEAALRQNNISSIEFQSLEFDNVTFSYPNAGRAILNNLSFQLEKGKRYAFVGENGAGKTTITKLLLGLYDVQEGEIRINGKNIKEYTYPQLKSFFSVAFQDYSKYQISVKDSIGLGIEDSTEEDIIRALHFVGLEPLFNQYEDFINQELGKLGKESIDLSLGQWQRVAIARTLISDHSILILDEVTAAIDPVQESEIYKLFEKTSQDKTTVFITHRLGATKFVDCIFVIDGGSVVEKGTHEELIELDLMYAAMYKEQSRWYE